MKQVIVIRRDLSMRRGKECSQSSHSSSGFFFAKLKRLAPTTNTFQLELTDEEIEWFNGNRKKICLQVASEDELLDLHENAKKAGLTSYLVKDAGLTEFGGQA